MEDYRLPVPLVGMLRATTLAGKPLVKKELLSTKLHVKITWDIATSAQKKSKKRQSTKTTKPAPDTQQPANSSTPQPAPAPALHARAPPASLVCQPTKPATPAPPPTNPRSQPTPTPAAKRPTPSPDTTNDDAAKFNAAPRQNQLPPSTTRP